MNVAAISPYAGEPANRTVAGPSATAGSAGEAGLPPSASAPNVDTVSLSPKARALSDEKVTREVQQLRQDEMRVKAHEAAHKSAGGQYAGSVSYSYRQGPDGRNYVTGGEVQIDVSPEQSPRDTISKMSVVIRAAMAPSDPSGQDRAVAAQASSQMAEAQRQQATGSASGQQGGAQPSPEGNSGNSTVETVAAATAPALSPPLSVYA